MRCLKVESNVVTDIQIHETCPIGLIEQPAGVRVGIGYTYDPVGDTYDAPPPPPPPRPTSKETRDHALENLEYDFGDGRVMQTRPKDEQNINGAIELIQTTSITTVDWVMKDNVKHAVTELELTSALNAGRLAAKAIWDNYTPD